MGQRASDTIGVTFEDVVIPYEVSSSCLCSDNMHKLPQNLLGLLGEGFEIVMLHADRL